MSLELFWLFECNIPVIFVKFRLDCGTVKFQLFESEVPMTGQTQVQLGVEEEEMFVELVTVSADVLKNAYVNSC